MRRLVTLAGIAFLAGGILCATGAGVAIGVPRTHVKAGVHRLDLSSMAKIRHYLRSIGVDPRDVVIQRGHRNYAGPHCPGKGWNCTRATRVVQIATASGQNQFKCTPSMNQVMWSGNHSKA